MSHVIQWYVDKLQSCNGSASKREGGNRDLRDLQPGRDLSSSFERKSQGSKQFLKLVANLSTILRSKYFQPKSVLAVKHTIWQQTRIMCNYYSHTVQLWSE